MFASLNILPAHKKRIVTGVSLVVLLAILIGLGGWTLRLAVALVSGLALWEFFGLYWPSGVHTGRKVLGVVLGTLVVFSQAVDPLWTLAVLGLTFIIVGMFFLFEYGRGNEEARLGHYSPVLHGLFYIPLLLQLALYFTPTEQCLVLAAAIGSDIGGYYAGTMLGKRKLWPVISPNKTWAGFWGGMGLCVFVCLVIAAIGKAADLRMLNMPLPVWFFIGLVLHQAALFGDLFESVLKRSLSVKDSGSLLPGHGGMLDRIDSILFTVPIFMLLRQILRFF